MQLYDLTAQDELQWLLANGYIREQEHPSEPLRIINYTDRAQTKPELFDQFESLSYCRGLIYNTVTMEIVARPFPKFWNYGQPGAAELDLDEPVYTTDKVDGSLGILYREPNGGQLAIATRGSFTSDQAIHATILLGTQYSDIAMWGPEDPRGKYSPADEDTYLFEILYPGNRIVLDYGDTDDLILLGSVDMETGFIHDIESSHLKLDWFGPVAEELEYTTLADALAAPPRENREGIVVSTPGGRKMVKIKQEDYLRLHKIVFGLSERRVWQAIVAGDSLATILEPLPDEFHAWVKKVYARIMGEAILKDGRIRQNYIGIMTETDWSEFAADDFRSARAKFAQIVKDDPDAWAYFMLYNGRGDEIRQRIIEKQLEPKGDIRPNFTTKEV